MPAVTYSLLATQVPLPQIPSTYIDPAGGPTILRPLTSGLSMVADWAYDMGHVEALGRLGAGVYGVGFGLDISSADAGLVGDIAAGAALLDVETKVGALTLALATNTDNYLWLGRDGSPHKRTTADAGSMLLPPDTAQPYAYLGLLHKDGSDNTTIIDLSGVCYVRGGVLWRRTADPGMPGDTPPAGSLFLTRTAGGLWLWDGGAYTAVGENLPIPLTDAATVVTDASLGNSFSVTLAGNRTLGAPSNPTDGQRITWRFTQGSGGSHTLALASGAGGFTLGTDITSTTLSTAAGKIDYLGAIYSLAADRWHVIELARGF